MPGFCGIASRRPISDLRAQVESMVAALRHEAFYHSGAVSFDSLGVAAGWTSLPGSFADGLPAWNPTRDIGLLFAGDAPVPLAAHTRLHAAGRRFDPADATGIVHLYEEFGDAFARELPGWFAGLLVDLRRGRAILFNDRYGLGRIYFHQSPDGFYFASEAKALLQVLPATRRTNLTALAETVSCGCPLQNRTPFRDIQLLPGASAWRLSADLPPDRKRYFSPKEWEELPTLDAESYPDRLAEALRASLPRCLGGRQPVALSLTGGLDSRMILALADLPSTGLPTYTFAGPYRECADVRIARRIAALCHCPHHLIPVGADFLKQFLALAARTVYLTDGAMDVSGAVELYVNRIARDIAPVRVTGNYGSEVIRSNVAFRPDSRLSEVYTPEFREEILEARRTYAAEAAMSRLSFVLFKQVPWHHYARLAVEQSQLTVRTPFLDPWLAACVYQAPRDLQTDLAPSLRVIRTAHPRLAEVPTDRGITLGDGGPVLGLRHQWQEFTVRAEYAFDYGMPQWLARGDAILKTLHLERLFLGRHKFYHFRIWYRDHLTQQLREILLDPKAKSRPYLCGDQLERLVEDHAAGRRNHTSTLHRLLSLELLHRQLIERNWMSVD